MLNPIVGIILGPVREPPSNRGVIGVNV